MSHGHSRGTSHLLWEDAWDGRIVAIPFAEGLGMGACMSGPRSGHQIIASSARNFLAKGVEGVYKQSQICETFLD